MIFKSLVSTTIISSQAGTPPIGDPPAIAVAPVVTGNARLDETLSCSTGTWTGSPDSYAYQWTRNGDDIVGETGNTYVVAIDDLACFIACDVEATNAIGTSDPESSNSIEMPDDISFAIASACGHLDATVTSSYTSGQTFANIVASPADGSAQTDNDFWLGFDSGATATDPTFTGTPGDAAAYFAVNGDYFSCKNTPAAVTLAKAHRTDRNGTWIVLAMQTANADPSTGTGKAFFGSSWGAADIGVYLFMTTGETLSVYQANGAAQTSAAITGAGGVVAATDYLIAIWIDGTATTNNIRKWINSATKSSHNMTLGTSTTDSDEVWRVFAGSSAAGTVANGIMEANSRLYAFAWGYGAFDDAQMAKVRDYFNYIHDRTYF